MLVKDLDLVTNVLHTGQKSFAKTAAQEAMARVRAFCESSIAARLARVEEDLAKLRAAHVAPIEASDEIESYATIEAWYVAENDGQGHPPLTITFDGPFPDGFGKGFYYCRLPNARSSRGATRSEALANMAKWCAQKAKR